jgi:hypothetical protein
MFPAPSAPFLDRPGRGLSLRAHRFTVCFELRGDVQDQAAAYVAPPFVIMMCVAAAARPKLFGYIGEPVSIVRLSLLQPRILRRRTGL